MHRLATDSPPYLSCCLIVRNCAQTLRRALESIRSRAPDCEISIVDTCSIDDSGMDFFVPRAEWPQDILDREVETRLGSLGTMLFVDDRWDAEIRVRVKTEPNPHSAPVRTEAAKMFGAAMGVKTVRCEYGPSTVEIAEEYADVFEVYRGPRGDWDEKMGWFDDAAAARNRSFENAHGTWRLWLDSDDELVDPKEAERLLRLNGRFQPMPPGGDVTVEKSTEVIPLEDILRHLEQAYPEQEVVWCPYLYRQDKDGHATEWQDRERIVRNCDEYTWKERAHEVLVAKLSSRAQRRPLYLAHLLFVHRKRFTAEESQYALARHFDVLLQQYDSGRRTHRVCVYLENYSRFLCPSRRGEFVHELYDSSSLPTDRYRALLKVAEFYADNGLFIEAMESIQSALLHKPELPDAYLVAGNIYARVDDPANAGRWMAKGVRCHSGLLEAETNPFAHLVKARVAAAMNLREGAWLALEGLHLEEAEKLLDEALELMEDRARYSGTLTREEQEDAIFLTNFVRNDREALRQARAIYHLWDYLVHNDETEKALKLLDAVPHNIRFHPLVVTIDRWGDKVRRHLDDRQAYIDFYNDAEATGFMTTEQCGDKEHERLYARGQAVLAQLPRDRPLRILEIGCADGCIAIPILRHLANVVEYVGVDANGSALIELRRVAEKYGLGEKVRTVESLDLDDDASVPQDYFDVVFFLEVIEHVQDPAASIHNLLYFLKPGGCIFVSTPWGAYDKGSPSRFEKRDPRGHVRALMPRDLVEILENAGTFVEKLDSSSGVFGSGAVLVARATEARVVRGRPVAFIVPGALWDWNASVVLEGGIGASEETIVFAARELVRDGHKVEVYGPMPRGMKLMAHEEVDEGVAYWTRQQLRLIPEGARVIISRAPYYGSRLDQAIDRPTEKILWLQDAFYDDLNAKTAATYRDIVVLSEWHRDMIARTSGLDPTTLTVVPNFVIPEHFRQEVARRPHHFIWTSSPDRGLNILLAMWPRILETWADATLDIFYGWRGCMKLSAIGAPAWNETYRKVRRVYEQVRWQRGVTERGMVSHERIAREMLSASAWCYPTDFAETFCVHPDTMVSVPGDHHNGTLRIRIADLLGRTNVPVYCYDEDARRFCIGTMLWCARTRVVNEMIEMTLDNERLLRCTPDHLVMNFDGDWVRADTVAAGTRLTALHHHTLAGGAVRKNHCVVAVRRTLGGPVYDMEVVEHHNFVGDGVVLHNCSTAVKSRAAGCVPVTRRFAGLCETADCKWTQWVEPQAEFRSTELPGGEAFEEYARANIAALEAAFELPEDERQRMSEEAIEKYAIGNVMHAWRKLVDDD